MNMNIFHRRKKGKHVFVKSARNSSCQFVLFVQMNGRVALIQDAVMTYDDSDEEPGDFWRQPGSNFEVGDEIAEMFWDENMKRTGV